MNKTTVSKMIFGAVLLLFTACTQDELAEQGTALPDGEYPLQIGSVSITAEVSEEPWTRVAENETDGMGSIWQPYDAITVSLNGETATYTYDGSAWTSETPLYWKNTQTATVTAWYTSPSATTDGTINLSDQSSGLAYVLQATAPDASYNNSVSLEFKHQLAKVRVKPSGNIERIKSIEVYSYTTCTAANGTVATGNEQGWITMKESDYNGEKCWEANVAPDVKISSLRLNGYKETLLGSAITSTAGALHEITIGVTSAIPPDAQEIDLSREVNIDKAGRYVFRGTGSSSIMINGFNDAGPYEIYLEDVNINVDYLNYAIYIINKAKVTFHVVGTDNHITATPNWTNESRAGIYVAQGCSLTITADDPNSTLYASGCSGGAGIGGWADRFISADCGDITIQNVTVHASGSGSDEQSIGAGIGGAGYGEVGTLTIQDATVHTYGGSNSSSFASGIGVGFSSLDGTSASALPKVVVSNSIIHTHRGGGNADYIGWTGSTSGTGGGTNSIQAGADGSITNSTVYCYTGDTLDKTVTYDASGIGTEQSQ